MLSASDNELMCRVGPGTPTGEMMREHWIPAIMSRELPGPDSDPVRVRLLCEDLVAFRDTNGAVGLVDNFCPHRRASLFFGRNEECGLRCVYHGWKFDVNGDCVDMPSEPAESNFKDKVKIKAYPCQERNGIVWTYMGTRTELPPLPNIEPNMLPDDVEQSVWTAMRDCNFVQALEGDIDTSHLGFLHLGSVTPEKLSPGSYDYYTVKDRAPLGYDVVDTDYGTSYGAWRPAEADTTYWRVAHFLLPFYTMIPTSVLGWQILVRAWVPIDDEHTMFWNISGPNPFARGIGSAGRGNNVPGASLLPEFLPQTSGFLGRWRLAANAENDYRIDREAQKNNTIFTGISGIPPAGPVGDGADGGHCGPNEGAPGRERLDGDQDAAAHHAGRHQPAGGRDAADGGPAGAVRAALRRDDPAQGAGLVRGDARPAEGFRRPAGAGGRGPGAEPVGQRSKAHEDGGLERGPRSVWRKP